MANTRTDQYVAVPSNHGIGYVYVRRTIYNVDTYGHALTRGTIHFRGQEWIVGLDDVWHLEVPLSEARERRHLNYRERAFL